MSEEELARKLARDAGVEAGTTVTVVLLGTPVTVTV